MVTEEDIAKAAYAAFSDVVDDLHIPGLTFRTWEELTPKQRKGWLAAIKVATTYGR